MDSQNERARGASLTQLQAVYIPGVKDVEGIDNATASPSVSNNHSAAGTPGVDMPAGAGFYAGADAAFNGGDSDDVLHLAHRASTHPILQKMEVSEYANSGLDGKHITLELMSPSPGMDGLQVGTHIELQITDPSMWPAAEVIELKREIRHLKIELYADECTTEVMNFGGYPLVHPSEPGGPVLQDLVLDHSPSRLSTDFSLICAATASLSNPDQVDNPRIFFADEPRPSIWNFLGSETQRDIEAFAFGDLDAEDRLADDGIVVELAHDSAKGWHDTSPIVRVRIDGNEWNLEFEERIVSEDSSGNEDGSVGEATENEEAAAYERKRRELCKRLYRGFRSVDKHGLCSPRLSSDEMAQLLLDSWGWIEASAGYMPPVPASCVETAEEAVHTQFVAWYETQGMAELLARIGPMQVGYTAYEAGLLAGARAAGPAAEAVIASFLSA